MHLKSLLPQYIKSLKEERTRREKMKKQYTERDRCVNDRPVWLGRARKDTEHCPRSEEHKMRKAIEGGVGSSGFVVLGGRWISSPLERWDGTEVVLQWMSGNIQKEHQFDKETNLSESPEQPPSIVIREEQALLSNDEGTKRARGTGGTSIMAGTTNSDGDECGVYGPPSPAPFSHSLPSIYSNHGAMSSWTTVVLSAVDTSSTSVDMIEYEEDGIEYEEAEWDLIGLFLNASQQGKKRVHSKF